MPDRPLGQGNPTPLHKLGKWKPSGPEERAAFKKSQEAARKWDPRGIPIKGRLWDAEFLQYGSTPELMSDENPYRLALTKSDVPVRIARDSMNLPSDRATPGYSATAIEFDEAGEPRIVVTPASRNPSKVPYADIMEMTTGRMVALEGEVIESEIGPAPQQKGSLRRGIGATSPHWGGPQGRPTMPANAEDRVFRGDVDHLTGSPVFERPPAPNDPSQRGMGGEAVYKKTYQKGMKEGKARDSAIRRIRKQAKDKMNPRLMRQYADTVNPAQLRLEIAIAGGLVRDPRVKAALQASGAAGPVPLEEVQRIAAREMGGFDYAHVVGTRLKTLMEKSPSFREQIAAPNAMGQGAREAVSKAAKMPDGSTNGFLYAVRKDFLHEFDKPGPWFPASEARKGDVSVDPRDLEVNPEKPDEVRFRSITDARDAAALTRTDPVTGIKGKYAGMKGGAFTGARAKGETFLEEFPDPRKDPQRMRTFNRPNTNKIEITGESDIDGRDTYGTTVYGAEVATRKDITTGSRPEYMPRTGPHLDNFSPQAIANLKRLGPMELEGGEVDIVTRDHVLGRELMDPTRPPSPRNIIRPPAPEPEPAPRQRLPRIQRPGITPSMLGNATGGPVRRIRPTAGTREQPQGVLFDRGPVQEMAAPVMERGPGAPRVIRPRQVTGNLFRGLGGMAPSGLLAGLGVGVAAGAAGHGLGRLSRMGA